eukprot:5554138-Pleurochrysis_carterae.AAC.1
MASLGWISSWVSARHARQTRWSSRADHVYISGLGGRGSSPKEARLGGTLRPPSGHQASTWGRCRGNWNALCAQGVHGACARALTDACACAHRRVR